MTIKNILRYYELVFRLKVNFFKSRFGAFRVDPVVVMRYADFLNYKLLKCSLGYLLGLILVGCVFGILTLKNTPKNCVLENIGCFLWGRVCLLNSIIFALP